MAGIPCKKRKQYDEPRLVIFRETGSTGWIDEKIKMDPEDGDSSAAGDVYVVGEAEIPRDRHGYQHRHRHGHPRRLPREDRREDVGVSGDFPVQLACTSRTRTTILADLSDTRAFPREDVR